MLARTMRSLRARLGSNKLQSMTVAQQQADEHAHMQRQESHSGSPHSQFAKMFRAKRWLQHPKWAAVGYCTSPSQPRLLGCLRRFAGVRFPSSSAFSADSENVSNEALVPAPRGWGGRQGVLHGRVRAQIAWMSLEVCLLGWSDSFVFRSDCEDVLSEALVSPPALLLPNVLFLPPPRPPLFCLLPLLRLLASSSSFFCLPRQPLVALGGPRRRTTDDDGKDFIDGTEPPRQRRQRLYISTTHYSRNMATRSWIKNALSQRNVAANVAAYFSFQANMASFRLPSKVHFRIQANMTSFRGWTPRSRMSTSKRSRPPLRIHLIFQANMATFRLLSPKGLYITFKVQSGTVKGSL